MKVIFLSLAFLSLAGCSANWNAIHIRENAGTTPTVSVDAKQRFLVSTPRSNLPNGANTGDSRNDPPRIICTEPSPDAVSVLSSSFAGGAGLNLTKPDQTQVAAQLNAALSRVENGGYTGLRTQTIQLLRDGMYRLCEGYAAGALSGNEFRDLQRRYQSVMLALLSIEQITGTIAQRPTVFSGSAAAMTGDSLQVVQEKYTEALEKKVKLDNVATDAKTALATATTALEKAEAENKKCDQKCANKDQIAADLEKASAEKNEKSKDSDAAAKVAAAHKKYVGELENAVGKGGQTLKTLASGGAPSTVFDPTDTNRAVMTSGAAKFIADTARRIVGLTQVGGFGLEMCWRTQSSDVDGARRDIFCEALVSSIVASLDPSEPLSIGESSDDSIEKTTSNSHAQTPRGAPESTRGSAISERTNPRADGGSRFFSLTKPSNDIIKKLNDDLNAVRAKPEIKAAPTERK
jgi:hypothetical protein